MVRLRPWGTGALVFAASVALAQSPPAPVAPFAERVALILGDPALAGALVGLHVETLDGRVLYQHQSNLRLVPASNQKIPAVLYALATFGPEVTWKTRVWWGPEGVTLDAPGDPTISVAQWQALRDQFGPAPGSLVRARMAFNPMIPVDWQHDDLPFSYAARVQALTVDRGRFPLRLVDGKVVVPPWAGVRVEQTITDGDLAWRLDRETGVLTVTGRPAGENRDLGQLALPNSAVGVAGLLGGKLSLTNTLPDREPNAVMVSPPLRELAKRCLEPSDNIIAEHLLLLAAAQEGPLGPDPYATAGRRFAAWAQKWAGLEPTEFRPRDGSGMSRHNLVSARAMARFLQRAMNSELREVFVEALPAAGEGTLRSRLAGIPVFAKTGTLDVVSGLSGVVFPPGQPPVVFSVLMNHYSGSAADARRLQDRFVAELLRFP